MSKCDLSDNCRFISSLFVISVFVVVVVVQLSSLLNTTSTYLKLVNRFAFNLM